MVAEVVGLDVSEQSLELASRLGIRALNSNIHKSDALFQSEFNGIGADAVIIAAAKQTLINDAAGIIQSTRGRIILIGQVGNEVSRDLFYKRNFHFKWHAVMDQEDMIRIMKIKPSIIRLVL